MKELIEIFGQSTWDIETLKIRCTIPIYLPKVEETKYKELKKKFPNLSNEKSNKFYKNSKGFLLFEIEHEPLLEFEDFKRIVNDPNDYPLIGNLYDHFLNTYFHLYKECMYWYMQNTAVKGVFDYEEQVMRYEALVVDKHSCPIIKEINVQHILNYNFKKEFVLLLKKSFLDKKLSVNSLLYGTDNSPIKPKYTSDAEDVMNTVINIVYRRFKNFLYSEMSLNIPKNKINYNRSLTTYFNNRQLKLLHQFLIESEYIDKISLEKFVNCLSGRDVSPIHRIVWKKSKPKAYFLFSLISTNFQIAKLNVSVKKGVRDFDSNDRNRKSFYKDLGDILHKIDPGNKNFATP